MSGLSPSTFFNCLLCYPDGFGQVSGPVIHGRWLWLWLSCTIPPSSPRNLSHSNDNNGTCLAGAPDIYSGFPWDIGGHLPAILLPSITASVQSDEATTNRFCPPMAELPHRNSQWRCIDKDDPPLPLPLPGFPPFSGRQAVLPDLEE